MDFQKLVFFVFFMSIIAVSCNPEKERPANSKTNAKSSSSKSDTGNKEVEQKELSVSTEQYDRAKTILANVNAADVSAVDTKKIYKAYCAICHGFNGNAMVNGAKDLTKSAISKEEAIAQIYFGKGLMIPYKSTLSEAEIVAMADYVEEFRN